MEQYNVTGMSCAACSARVEKAVSKVPGVASCSVSLLTNSMGVEGTASSAEIIKAVQDAGYGASPKRAGAAAASSTSADLDALADHETPKLKRRLIASLGFLLVLMYFSMGHMMWGWPLPHIMWPMEKYISTSRKPSEAMRRRLSFGVSWSANASRSALASEVLLAEAFFGLAP